jgi:SAM-dependent methyltransferase
VPDYYDFEYAHQEMLRNDVPFFLEQLDGNQSVLELAVGTGRCAIPIAQAGHRVVGTDNDSRMLALAEQKRQAAGLTDRQLTLLGGDIVGLDLGKQFDWVALFFNTFLVFTTIEEQDRALAAVRRHLKPRGRFWLDIFHPDPALLARPHAAGLEPQAFYVPALDRTVFKTTEVRRNLAAQTQRVTFHYTWFDARGRERREKTEFDLAFVFPRELRLLLERNGLRLEQLYGNYDGSDLAGESPRMIACCAAG